MDMNDYHSNASTYTYDDAGRLSTITSPGSKTWDYDYNALGQPTQYEHPNGMKTYYSYDTRNRMTKIEHKDGETVKQSFTYALDDTGNITRTTNEDGSLWDYEYDGRYRLTKAERDNASTPTVTATYEYTYDDGDNLVTKVMPWIDDFQDGDYTGWSSGGGWSASNGLMENSPTSSRYFYRSQTDADYQLRFTYANYDTSDSGYWLSVQVRRVDSNNKVQISLRPDTAELHEIVNGGYRLRDSASISTTEDMRYDVRIVADGDDITVWRGERGGPLTEILSYDGLSDVLECAMVFFSVAQDATYGIDNIELIADNFSTTTTLAYNNANELTSMSQDGSATVSFTYDEWGRTISKYTTNDSADYYYRYGGKLYSVTSDFPDEGTVTYDYGGDQKRRQRTVGGTSTWYNWDSGWNVINEESGTGSGSLTNTYVVGPSCRRGTVLADVPGSNPSTGSYSYYMHDNIGSTRALYDQSKNNTALYEFTPYGDMYASSGSSSTTHLFTGHDWDATSQLYFAPYRYYNPYTARWMTRDPLGMVDGPNTGSYAQGNPAILVDPLGLFCGPGRVGDWVIPNYCWPTWRYRRLFSEACEQHDLCYGRRGRYSAVPTDETGRRACDKFAFYLPARAACDTLQDFSWTIRCFRWSITIYPYWSRGACLICAHIYFLVLRESGGEYFYRSRLDDVG